MFLTCTLRRHSICISTCRVRYILNICSPELTQCKLCFQGTPYSSLRVRVPWEVFPAERRVTLTPQNVAFLCKKGFAEVLVECDTGTHAQLLNEDYKMASATIPHNFGWIFSFPTPSSVVIRKGLAYQFTFTCTISTTFLPCTMRVQCALRTIKGSSTTSPPPRLCDLSAFLSFFSVSHFLTLNPFAHWWHLRSHGTLLSDCIPTAHHACTTSAPRAHPCHALCLCSMHIGGCTWCGTSRSWRTCPLRPQRPSGRVE
jgi:hypothetical protein